MTLSNTKEFPFSMETAWAALHKPAMLDVEPGAEVRKSLPSNVQAVRKQDTILPISH